MQLRDYLSNYAGPSPKSLVGSVADWLEEQARTPAVPPSCDTERRLVTKTIAEEVIRAYMDVEAKEPGAQQRMAEAIAALDVYVVRVAGEGDR